MRKNSGTETRQKRAAAADEDGQPKADGKRASETVTSKQVQQQWHHKVGDQQHAYLEQTHTGIDNEYAHTQV